MSTRELDRLQVLGRVAERRLSQHEAARVLGVTERQLRRLWVAYQRDGAAGLTSRKRGRRSNNRLPDAAKDHVIALVRERYADFGPTFAQEKLVEYSDGLNQPLKSAPQTALGASCLVNPSEYSPTFGLRRFGVMHPSRFRISPIVDVHGHS